MDINYKEKTDASIDLSQLWLDKYTSTDASQVFSSRIEDFEKVWFPIPDTDQHLLFKYNPMFMKNVSCENHIKIIYDSNLSLNCIEKRESVQRGRA